MKYAFHGAFGLLALAALASGCSDDPNPSSVGDASIDAIVDANATDGDSDSGNLDSGSDASVTITGISLDQESLLIDEGDRATLVVTALLQGGGDMNITSGVTVTAGDTAVASLSGLEIVGESAGLTTLTLSYAGHTDTIEVGVREIYGFVTEPSPFFERAGFSIGTASSNDGVSILINDGTAYEGTESMKITYPGTQQWGGIFMFSTGTLDASDFAGGHIIVHVHDSSAIGSMFVKLEWTGSPVYDGLPLSSYTPTTTLAGWKTYEIPLADFPSIDLSTISHLGFWHPCVAGTCPALTPAYSGTVIVDGVVLRGPSPFN